MAKLHPIAKELSTVYGIKPGTLSDKALAKKLHDAATDEGPEADEKWESLTDETQAWVNAGTDALENDEALPGWDVAAEQEAPKAKGKAKAKDADEEEEEEEDEKPAKKGAKASKAKAKDEDEEEEDEDEKPAKKSSAKSSKGKPTPKAEKTPAKKKAASADRDEGAITGQWIKIFTAVQKKGAKGIARADLDALCEKYDRKPHYGRFIRAEILEYVERGVLKLSKTGEKALASAEE